MSIHKGKLETKTGNNTSDILYPKTSIDQVVGLPVPTSADSGKYLGVDSNGNFALISGTPSGYTVTITNGLSADHDVVLYDGQDNTGTYLGVLSVNTSDSYTITSGYIYAEWDNPLTTGDVTFKYNITDLGNPAEITGSIALVVGINQTNVYTINAYSNNSSLGSASSNYNSVPIAEAAETLVELTATEINGTFNHWEISDSFILIEGDFYTPFLVIIAEGDVSAEAVFY